MLDIDNKVFRNLPEQVLWNKEQIERWIENGGVAEIVELTPDPNVFFGNISQDIIDRISGKPLVFVFCGQDVYVKFSEGTAVINFLGIRVSNENHIDHTDIKTYKLNILKFPKKWNRSSSLFFETYSKVQLDAIISTLKQNSYQDVDTSTYPTLADFLATTGEEGYIYLYPVNVLDLSKGYMMYIWESSAWRYLGTTALDLSNYYNKTETDALLATKANDSEVVNLAGDQTITGVKKINTLHISDSGFLRFGNNINSTSKYFQANGASVVFGRSSGTPIFILGNSSFAPMINDFSIGSSSYPILNLYAKNIIDGANSVTTEDLANLIAYAKAQGWIS